MKHIKVLPVKTTISEKTVDGIYNRATIACAQEQWSISVNCQERDNKTDRELTLIKVFTPDNKTWEGSIADFTAMRSIAINALHFIDNIPHNASIGHLYEDAVEVKKELKHLLSLFK